MNIFKWSLLLLITIAVISSANPAEAAKWDRVAESKTEILYIDMESIIGNPDGSKDVQVKYVHKTPECTDWPKLIQENNIVYERKCKEKMVGYDRLFKNKSSCSLQIMSYFTDGTHLDNSISCNPTKIIPGTVNESLWEYLYRPTTQALGIPLTPPADTAAWIQLKAFTATAATPFSATLSIDKSSITDGPNSSKEAWSKFTLKKDGEVDEVTSLSYSRYLRNGKVCVIKQIRSTSNGTYQSKDTQCNPQDTAPDSLTRLEWQFVFSPTSGNEP